MTVRQLAATARRGLLSGRSLFGAVGFNSTSTATAQPSTAAATVSAPPAASLIRLTNASIYRLGQTEAPLFQDLTWHLGTNETWAIIGPVGSGRSTLFTALQGKLRVLPAASLKYDFIRRLEAKGDGRDLWPSQLIKVVSFETTASTAAYMQERYHSYRDEDDLTLRQWIKTRDTDATDSGIENAAQKLGLAHLLDGSLMNLSNGQSRRARILEALLAKPEILLLDEPFMGLDPDQRRTVSKVLRDLAETGETKVILSLRAMDRVPSWVTHTLQLSGRGKIEHIGPVEDMPTLAPEVVEEQVTINPSKLASSTPTPRPAPFAIPPVELKNVTVTHRSIQILKNISWTIHAGSRWALLGSNGSGKTTLLALILGDHPQCYSQDISMFGRRRGTGETLWSVQREIGHVSPEVHNHFPRGMRVLEAVFGGWYENRYVAKSSVTPEQKDDARALLEESGLHGLEDKEFRDLSTGEQRLVLICRALITRPKLLILDEPFQGMDEGMVEMCKKWLDEKLDEEQALVFVTHVQEEVPGCIDRILRLDKGEVVEMK
ncbi:hypothetical protein YB2330_001112 [Saitoella coloradoensis]